ncbi:hypothetical protein, partial [Actinokineospora diospyrosa]
AEWTGQAGDPTAAAQAHAELLVDRIRVLGPDHPNVQLSRLAVARWRKQAGLSGADEMVAGEAESASAGD